MRRMEENQRERRRRGVLREMREKREIFWGFRVRLLRAFTVASSNLALQNN
jgi:hypothetical protein